MLEAVVFDSATLGAHLKTLCFGFQEYYPTETDPYGNHSIAVSKVRSYYRTEDLEVGLAIRLLNFFEVHMDSVPSEDLGHLKHVANVDNEAFNNDPRVVRKAQQLVARSKKRHSSSNAALVEGERNLRRR